MTEHDDLLEEDFSVGDCHSNTDGDCDWDQCPQKVHYQVGCPLFDWDDPDRRF